MEDNAELFIDPEEDEVFFFGVTEKESLVKSALENKMQLETKKINESCPNQNDHSSKDIEEKLQLETTLSTNKTHMGFEQITDVDWLSDSSDLLSVPFARASKNENIADKYPVTVRQESLKSQAIEDYIESPKKQNTPGKKKLDERNGLPSIVNIHIDHSYSIPMKNVIDKDILKTPKSIVKADKDGGFLKVLSEIALVKAEIDENNLGDIKKLTDISSTEKLNDDDKENKQSDTEKTNVAIKQGDLSPAKVCHDLIVNKANYEIQKKNSCSFEKVNEDHLDCSGITDLGNEKIAEIINEQFAGNKKSDLESFHTDMVLNDPIDELCLVRSLSLTNGGSHDPKIAFEKPNDNIMNDNLANASGTTENITNGPNMKEFDALMGKSYDENITPKINEGLERICAYENNYSKEESEITHVSLLKLPAADASMEAGGKDDSFLPVDDTNSSEKERRKKFIRRNTMRLLEELNEQVTFGQSKRESLGPVCNEKLSEEAAKVIQKLKAVGFDDSICSPEQYFDLDKLDSSVFNSEISDVLNDTLSKPLSHITSKDVESLLEKIKAHSLEAENEIYSDDEFNSRKENSNNPEMNKNLVNESEKYTTDHQESSEFGTDQFVGNSKNENNRPNCGISEQCETNKKVTEGRNVLSGNKKVIPSQPMPTRPKEFRSVEKKYRGLTRIPKLVSTTSKVPVTAKEVNQELGYRPLNKTPFLKAQKSLKFNNIDSTVNTNVNPKTPVTFSSGKGRAGTKDDAINARTKSVNNKPNTKNLFPKSETKFNPQQFLRFKSGMSLKEHSTESHAPKFVPKVLKVPCGDSPLVSKYGGSAQRTISKRP